MSLVAPGAGLKIDFSNTLSKSQIEEIATVDEFEVVKEVQVRLSRQLDQTDADDTRSILPTTWSSTLLISVSHQQL